MKFILQRVTRARVTVEEQQTGQIDQGLLILIGVGPDDTRDTADKMLKKMWNLRIFADENGKTNLSLLDVHGQLLLVSQFTLYANCRKGNRPSFVNAAPPALAEELYDYLVDACRREGIETQTGSFGADMQVSLCNDGPFTIVMDSGELGF